MRLLTASFCAALLAAHVLAGAQSAVTPTPAPRSSEAMLKTLASIGTISDIAWRAHEGDIAHPEAVDFNDSDWTPVKKGSPLGTDAAWVRATVTIPESVHGYELTGARLWLDAAFSSRPLAEIIYFDGRRVALGEDLEPIVLTENAKPGDKFVIAIKLLQSVEKKSFGRGDLRIEPAASRPNPADLREEILTATAMLPLTPGYKPEMLDEVDAIAASVDMGALVVGKQAAFDASLKSAHEKLLKFRPALQSITIDMAGNSHIDAAWRWTESETIDVVRRTYGTAVQLMSEYPEYKFTQSAAQYNEWLAQKYPAVEAEIKRRVKEGRWEIVGGMWVEPDCNMPDGESLVRQLLVGKRYFKHELGADVRIGWNPDSFGYTWQLPQIYKKSGIDYFVTQKMHWSDTNQLPLKLFWWESPDGSKVLTYFPTSYGHNDLKPSREAKDFTEAATRVPGSTEGLDLYGVGDHGGGPTRITMDEGIRWTKDGTVAPRMRFTTAQDFFTSTEKSISPDSREWNYASIAKGWEAPKPPSADKISIPTWKDELYLETHRGVFTTQALHKRNMRESEEAVLDAEKYASLAWLRGKAYPSSDFEESWKKICFGQFHDLAAGSGIAQIYKDAAVDYKRVFQQARDANDVSLAAILGTADTRAPGGVPIAIMNPLAWNRSEVVTVDIQMPEAADAIHIEDAKGQTVLSQVIGRDAATNTFHALVRVADSPSLGYTILHALPGAKPADSDLHADALTLENALLKVVVDPKSGNITSLIEKKTNFEMIAKGGAGNQLQSFKDEPKRFDAWNIDPGALDKFTPLENAASVKLVESGSRAVIRVERAWQKSHFTQDIILEAGADHVQFDNKVDWHEEHILLKAAFQLAATGPTATYEIPYGAIQRSTLRVNTFEKAMFEVPAIRWADLGDGQHGLTLINRTKYGYDAVGNYLRLSLLRGAIFPDPDADRGAQEFTYAVYPHAGDWKQSLAMRRGYEFNYPLRAAQTNPHPGADGPSHSFASTDADNVVLTAVKKAEDRNALVFRMFEWAGKTGDIKLQIPPGATSASLSNLMETPQSDTLKLETNTVTIPVKPYEIVTVQVSYDVK